MRKSSGIQVTATAFAALFSVVGLALYGLPLYYDFMVRELGWSRTMVTSGNAISKLVVGPLFGFAAGWIVDRFGPRRLMMAGIVMAGGALIGLGATSLAGAFYFFYFFNALGYVCGGPLPCQVLVSRWFDKTRGKAMGIAYLGIGIGGAIVPLLSAWLTARVGWRLSLQLVGGLVVLIALPLAFPVREDRDGSETGRDGDVASARPLAAKASAERLHRGHRSHSGVLSPRVRQHVLDRRRRRHQSAPEAVPEPRPRLLAVGGGGHHLAGAHDQHRRPAAHGLAGGPRAAQARHGADLPARGGRDSAAARTAAPGAATMYLFAAIFGLGLGGEYLIIPLMAGELFGVGVLGRVMGIVLTADGVAEATAPMLVGYLRDRTGSYNTGFFLLIGIALVGATAIAFLPAARRTREVHSLL